MAEIVMSAGRAALFGWAALFATTATSIVFAWSAVFGDIQISSHDHEQSDELSNIQRMLAETTPPKTQAIFDKPLFLPGRAPIKIASAIPAPVRVEPVQEEAPPPVYLVSGIVITPDKRRALLRTQADDPGLWLNEGEFTAEGWILASVNPTHVLLTRSGSRFVFEMYHHATP
jgi:type II secretory pathway component PulC